MDIWVDADACPKVIKEILYRAAERTETTVILVANQWLSTPISPFIKKIQVSSGFDVADTKITMEMKGGDLVVTADIPLASAVIDKGGMAINPRGMLYSKENIKQILSMRNFMEELRGSGVNTGGPPSLSQKNRQEFANQLDRILTQEK